MNYQSEKYRQCEQFGAPPPPTGPDPTPPINPSTPTISEMCNCIGQWTYFWTNTVGNGWIYVTLTGIGIDPRTNKPTQGIWGCLKNGTGISIPLINITNYIIHS